MAVIAIAKKHKLSHQKAKAAAEKVADDLNARFDLEYAWQGDHIDFKRPGLTGALHVGKDAVRLDCELGFMLSLLKPTIEAEVHKQFDKYFGKSKSASSRLQSARATVRRAPSAAEDSARQRIGERRGRAGEDRLHQLAFAPVDRRQEFGGAAHLAERLEAPLQKIVQHGKPGQPRRAAHHHERRVDERRSHVDCRARRRSRR